MKAISLIALLAACGSAKVIEPIESTSSAGGSGGSTTSGPNVVGGSSMGGTISTGGTTATGGGGCEPTMPAHPGNMIDVGLIEATIVAQNGVPVEDVETVVSGVDIAFGPELTDMGGYVGVDGGGTSITAPGFRYGRGRFTQPMWARLPAASVDFGTINTISLPSFAEGVEMQPGTLIEHNGVMLALPSDAVIEHDLLTFSDPSEHVFRGVRLDPTGLAFPALDPTLGIRVLVAVAPVNTTICPRAELRIRNEGAFPHGADVVTYLHGIRTFGHWTPVGGWTKVSEGTVDDPLILAGHVPMLGLFGIALKP